MGNVGQTSESGTTSMARTKAFAQGVVAGDGPQFLTDICVKFGTQPQAKDPVYVELWSSKLESLELVPDEGIATFWWDIDNGTDGDGVCEGSGQAEFTRRRPGRNDAAIELNSGDLYFVVLWAGLNDTDVTLRTTASNAEDSGGVGNYSIRDNSFKDTTTDSSAYTWTSATSKLQIQLYAEDTDGLRVHDAEGQEGTDMSFRLSLTPAPGNNRRLVVDYVTVEVPDERNDKGEIVKVHAKESKDYEWTSGKAIFNAGDTEKSASVPTINDTEQDDREKFKLVASTLKYYRLSQGEWVLEDQEDNPYLDKVRKRAGIGTIRNTDPVGLLSVADAEAAEEDASIDFVVTLNLVATETVTVDYATADRTATAGTDYTATSGTLTFEAGESTKTIAVPLVDDDDLENDETLTLTLSNATGAELGYAEAKGTIRDTKDSGAPVISGTLRVGETLTADTSGILDSDGLENATFTYRWWKRVGTIRRTLQNGADATYVLQPSDAGDRIIVRASFTDDAGNPEWRESEPTAPVASADGGSINRAPTGAPTVSGTAQVGETLTASTAGIADADGLDDAEFSYQWIRNDGSDADIAGATGQSYTPGADDTGKRLKVRVTFTDDGGTAETLTSAATGPVAARSALSVADAEATEEDDAALGFVVTLNPAAARTVTVDYATSDGTATAGDDYTATSGKLTFAVGDTSKTVSVPIADDSVDDGGETVTLTLSNATVAEISDASATGTIGDDDANSAPTGAPTITGTAQVGETLTASTAGIDDADGLDDAEFSYQWIGNDGSDADIAGATGQTYTPGANDVGKTLKVRVTFTDDGGTAETLTSAATGAVVARSALSVADAQASEEDDTALEFVVTLSPAAARTVTVDYATADGTATAGADYTATSGTLTFAVGDTAKTVSVPITDDTVDDGGETLTLTLSNAAVATISDASATGTISNEETGPPLTASFSEVPESHAGARFTFVLTFSEAPKVSYRTLRDVAFDVTDGTVRKAKRRTSGSNLSWDITVEPAGTGAVAIELPATPDCTTTGAICTGDGRALSNSPSATVAGASTASAVVNGPVLTLSWPTPPDGFAPPGGSDFAVSVDGDLRAVTSASFQARGVILQLAEPVLPQQSVVVDHLGSAMHPARSAAGDLRAPWRDMPALNVSGWTADELSAAGVDAPVPGVVTTVWNAGQSASFAGQELGDAGLIAVSGMTDLRRLDLSGNALTDVSALAGLGMLESLDLSGNAISNLAPLAELTELRRLDLAGNVIEELWPLAGLPKLEVLLLDGNRVVDIGALTHHGRLENLGLAGNRVADTRPLADLWSLRRLDLGGNPARDLSPVGDLETLVWLRVPSATDEAPTHRLIQLRWLMGPDGLGTCVGCASEETIRAPAR